MGFNLKHSFIFYILFCILFEIASVSRLPMRENRILNASAPNILLFLTDDQDLLLNSLEPMEQTKRLLADEGMTFNNAFTTTPICCPSRSSILTGLYLHNHGVTNNSRSGGCYSQFWQDRWESKTLGNVMRSAAYRTFYAGKYLNQYGVHDESWKNKPSGWDWWLGLVGNSVYYNYTLSVNGTARWYGDKPEDYLTDVLKGWALQFLRTIRNEPFFMIISPPAPHEPFTPSIKYKGTFSGAKAPRTPNFNTGTEGKHWTVSTNPTHLPADVINRVDNAFQSRWETLLSVDDMVSEVLSSLQASEQLDNTYIFFTSDHGFHLGQFAQAWDKRQPYDTDLRVPFLVRGPGIPAKSVNLAPVLLLDLAPTFYDLAGAFSPVLSDGVSLTAILRTPVTTNYNRAFLVEYRGEGGDGEPCWTDDNVKLCSPDTACKCFDAKNNTFTCVRSLSSTRSTLYCVFQDDDGFIERYDLKKDPYQLINLEV